MTLAVAVEGCREIHAERYCVVAATLVETLDNTIVKSIVCCGNRNASGRRRPNRVANVANGQEVTLSVVDQSKHCLRVVNKTQQRLNLLGIAAPQNTTALARLLCQCTEMSRNTSRAVLRTLAKGLVEGAMSSCFMSLEGETIVWFSMV